MATADITSWSIEAVEPDNTANAFMAGETITSTDVPPLITEVADFLTIGQKVKLSFTVDLAGTYSDGSTCELDGA